MSCMVHAFPHVGLVHLAGSSIVPAVMYFSASSLQTTHWKIASLQVQNLPVYDVSAHDRLMTW